VVPEKKVDIYKFADYDDGRKVMTIPSHYYLGQVAKKPTFFTVDSLVLHNKNIYFICASHLIPMSGMRAKPILMVQICWFNLPIKF
jgi:hypothetical protein